MRVSVCLAELELEKPETIEIEDPFCSETLKKEMPVNSKYSRALHSTLIELGAEYKAGMAPQGYMEALISKYIKKTFDR